MTSKRDQRRDGAPIDAVGEPYLRAPGANGEVRCDCGSLLARWIASGIELKCRRCKRRICIPFENIGGTLPARGPPR